MSIHALEPFHWNAVPTPVKHSVAEPDLYSTVTTALKTILNVVVIVLMVTVLIGFCIYTVHVYHVTSDTQSLRYNEAKSMWENYCTKQDYREKYLNDRTQTDACKDAYRTKEAYGKESILFPVFYEVSTSPLRWCSQSPMCVMLGIQGMSNMTGMGGLLTVLGLIVAIYLLRRACRQTPQLFNETRDGWHMYQNARWTTLPTTLKQD